MTTIAQAYLHTSKSGTDAELAEWGRHAQVLAYDIASSVFPMEVELEISFQVGSLISRALVRNIGAGLMAAYGSIAIYPEFKEGLLEAIADARAFSESFNEKFLSEAGIDSQDIVARQRRIETPGRIYRALERLENLEQNTSESSGSRYLQELQNAAYQLQKGLSDLGSSDQQQAVQLIVGYHKPRLPEPLRPQLMRHLEWNREDEFSVLVPYAEDGHDIKFLARLRTDEPVSKKVLLENSRTSQGKPRQ